MQEMMIVLAGWACDDHMLPIPWQKRIEVLSFRCTLSFSRLHTNVDPCDLEQIRPEIDRLIVVYHTVKDFLTDLTKGSIWARDCVRTPSDPGDDDPADNADDIEDSQQTLQLPGLEETQAAADIEDSQLPGLEETQTAADIEDSQLPGLEEAQTAADIEDSQLPGLEEAQTAADICFFHPPPVSAPPASEAPQVVADILGLHQLDNFHQL